MAIIRTLIVDDFRPWQQFLLTLFQSETDFAVIAVASDGWEAVHKAKELKPDLILMDCSLPGINGFEATRQICNDSPHPKILFLSEHRGPEFIGAAFEAGGCGYILKCDSWSDLIPGMKAILIGKRFISHSLLNWKNGSLTD